MKSSYRNVAIAAGGVLAAAVAASVLRARSNGKRSMVAQTMTVLLERDRVIERLDDAIIQIAVACEDLHINRDDDDRRLIEWGCTDHPHEGGRLAMIPAPNDRGTELHIAMRGDKYHVKEILRKMKMLLEAGEIATGVRQ